MKIALWIIAVCEVVRVFQLFASIRQTRTLEKYHERKSEELAEALKTQIDNLSAFPEENDTEGDEFNGMD